MTSTKARLTKADALPALGKPALRALASIGVTTRSQLARYTSAELLALHGFGPKAIAILNAAKVALRAKKK